MKLEHLPFVRSILKGIEKIQHFHPTPLDNPFSQQEKPSPSPPTSPRSQYSADPDPSLIVSRNSRTSSTRAYYNQPYPSWFKKNNTNQ